MDQQGRTTDRRTGCWSAAGAWDVVGGFDERYYPPAYFEDLVPESAEAGREVGFGSRALCPAPRRILGPCSTPRCSVRSNEEPPLGPRLVSHHSVARSAAHALGKPATPHAQPKGFGSSTRTTRSNASPIETNGSRRWRPMSRDCGESGCDDGWGVASSGEGIESLRPRRPASRVARTLSATKCPFGLGERTPGEAGE
jgi:hypothetical protein